MADDEVLSDTRDMVALHGAFRRAFADAPGQLAGVGEGDVATAERLAAYLGELLWLLHAHHAGEDALLYPLLRERLPEQAVLFATMDAQHEKVASSLTGADAALRRFRASASRTDGRACAAAIAALAAVADPHLVDEERDVLPLAARVVTPPEWGEMPAHALSHYEGDRIWLPLGIALEPMPDDIRTGTVSHLPPPVAAMWTGGGSAAFDAEMEAIRALAP